MPEIVITVEGGLIQNIEGIPGGVKVKVIDFDVDGTTDEGLTDVNGRPANVYYW